MSESNDADSVEALRAVVNRFGGEFAARKTALLDRCSRCDLADPRTLVAYHDLLLFLLAYPDNPRLLARTARELQRVAAAARRIAEGRSERKRRRVLGTGIAWSETSYAFSLQIARWLVHEHPDSAEINADGEGDAGLANLLRLCMPAVESALLDATYSGVDALLDEAKGTASVSNLSWLLAQLDRLQCSEEIREHLFESLGLFISIYPKDGPLSRTRARGLAGPVFFHREELLRGTGEALRLVGEPVPAPRPLSLRERVGLIDTARSILAMLGRETDPITLTWPGGVEYIEMSRGVSIALYAMQPRRRFSIDTHLGFMLFKNGVPVAYGGGWPFLETCRIGVNIFPQFRGGESALLFCSVMRVYRWRFGAERFLVEPYQFGAGNREGLLSGAFWFYYRLGFRPLHAQQAALARVEFARIGSNRGYRSPLTVMRRLTRSDVELRLSGEGGPQPQWPDPYALSAAVSEWIEREFAGDRAIAERAAQKLVSEALGVRSTEGWPEAERRSYHSLSLLVAMIGDFGSWSARERRDCIALMRAKGAKDETRYFTLVRRHRRLHEALVHIAGRDGR